MSADVNLSTDIVALCRPPPFFSSSSFIFFFHKKIPYSPPPQISLSHQAERAIQITSSKAVTGITPPSYPCYSSEP